MKTAAIASLLVLASASAFAPSQGAARSGIALQATIADLEGLPGKSLEVGGKVWDPWNCAQVASAEHLRKAELSNGRVAMLANVGWFWPQLAGTFSSDDVTTTDPIEAILQADPQWWAQWILFCGVIEGIKYRGELQGKSYTGDGPAVIDWAKQWDKLKPNEKEDMRLKELKNGRLAMIGIASYVSEYFIPDSVPFI